MQQKADADKLKELDLKIDQLEARKVQMENRFREKERKLRTRRLIQVGAIFEKYFEIQGKENAEILASGLANYVKENKEQLMKMGIDNLREQKDNT